MQSYAEVSSWFNWNNRWAIPACLFFAWLYMGPRYHWTQVLVEPLSTLPRP